MWLLTQVLLCSVMFHISIIYLFILLFCPVWTFEFKVWLYGYHIVVSSFPKNWVCLCFVLFNPVTSSVVLMWLDFYLPFCDLLSECLICFVPSCFFFFVIIYVCTILILLLLLLFFKNTIFWLYFLSGQYGLWYTFQFVKLYFI